jgi:hypothetical protein
MLLTMAGQIPDHHHTALAAALSPLHSQAIAVDHRYMASRPSPSATEAPNLRLREGKAFLLRPTIITHFRLLYQGAQEAGSRRRPPVLPGTLIRIRTRDRPAIPTTHRRQPLNSRPFLPTQLSLLPLMRPRRLLVQAPGA